MLRDTGIKREFVCEPNDKANLIAYAENGNIDDLFAYLNGMSEDKIRALFVDSGFSKEFFSAFKTEDKKFFEEMEKNLKLKAILPSDLRSSASRIYSPCVPSFFNTCQTIEQKTRENPRPVVSP